MDLNFTHANKAPSLESNVKLSYGRIDMHCIVNTAKIIKYYFILFSKKYLQKTCVLHVNIKVFIRARFITVLGDFQYLNCTISITLLRAKAELLQFFNNVKGRF